MVNFKEIGIIKSNFKESADPYKMRDHESRIIIHNEFEEGLFKIEEEEYLDIIFSFHKSEDYDLVVDKTYYGDTKGVFACRTPRRPSSVGLTRVKLLKRDKNELVVKGLDAIDGTPVVDIKPFRPFMDSTETKLFEREDIRKNPRNFLVPLIKNRKLEELLLLSGTIHGHYCPGLAMGVIASQDALVKTGAISDGLEKIIALVEINSCFVDGIQFVTGCTMGNNSLIYRDIGKTAFSLLKRDGTSIRYSQKNNYRDELNRLFPNFNKFFKKVVIENNRDETAVKLFKKNARELSFKLLEWDIDKIYDIKEVKLGLPPYAPIRDSVICRKCGEKIVKEKEINEGDNVFCASCAGSEFYQIDGRGIMKTDI